MNDFDPCSNGFADHAHDMRSGGNSVNKKKSPNSHAYMRDIPLDDDGEGPDNSQREEETPPREEGSKPRIRCNPGEIAAATEQAFKLLVEERDPFQAVYVRGPMLTRVVRYQSKGTNRDGLKRADGSTLLTPICPDWLTYHFAKRAAWYFTKKHPKKEGGIIEIERDVSDRIARNIMADAPWSGLPILAGIINAPTILLDGRLIQTPGFDEESGLLFDPDGVKFPKVPEKPTRQDALEALEVLKEPFKDFPFVDEVGLSVALAAAITALVRKSVRLAPMFVFDAPTPASGKTLLASTTALIATGLPPMLMAPNPDPESEKKALFAALLEGPNSIVIDNVEGEFGSATLCAILTNGDYSDRVLGVSKQARVDANSLFMCTGNNIVIKGDLGARTLLCRIDPRVEDPDTRTFERDLHKWIPPHRARLAVAALTIVKAYSTAHSPKLEVPNYGRFDEWQRLVRFPLIWLGCADPCKSRERIKTSNPEIVELEGFLAAWYGVYGGAAATINEALKRCDPATETYEQKRTEDEKSLFEVIKAVGGKRGQFTSNAVGNFLSSKEYRPINGLRFVKDGKRHQAVLWKIEPIEDAR